MDTDPGFWSAWAKRLWPDSPYLQAEWLRAIATVRSTQGGWLIEQMPIPQPVPLTYDPPLRIRA